MNLYRAFYEWPDGRASSVTFTSTPADALRWAGDYVRAFVAGYLTGVKEVRPVTRPPLTLL